MYEEQKMVCEFHKAFRHPVRNRPELMDRARVADRARWLEEEVNEFQAAEDIAGQADAMIDLIYFALGTLVEMGVDGAPLFAIVHEANMKKLWEDGRPRFGDDGKVMKPKTWSDPSQAILRELERQTKNSSSAKQLQHAKSSDSQDAGAKCC